MGKDRFISSEKWKRLIGKKRINQRTDIAETGVKFRREGWNRPNELRSDVPRDISSFLKGPFLILVKFDSNFEEKMR